MDKAKVATVIAGKEKYQGDIVIPSEVKYNDIVYRVESIGDSAFAICNNLTSITLSNSIKTLGKNAFYHCAKLVTIELPSSVLSIGDEAFSRCSELTRVVVGDGVTTIGNSAFAYCTNLPGIELPGSVTELGGGVFRSCKKFTTVELPNSITTLGNYLFEGCNALTSIKLPENCKTIPIGMFSYCSVLDDVTIPNSVTSIGKYAFEGCTSLSGMEFPNSIKAIGAEAFKGCVGLVDIELPENLYTVSDGLFSGCTALKSVIIPNNCSIGNNAFYDCTSLTEIEIPSNSIIGSSAFYNCSALVSIIIGRGTQFILEKAFAKCESLSDVYCYATVVPSAKTNTFEGSYPESMTLHVPVEAINDYKSTVPWSKFGSIVSVEEGKVEKCAVPSVAYNNGELTFACETVGAEFVTDVTSDDINKYYTRNIPLSATYNISVYAVASGYENSDVVNVTLCWVENKVDNNNTTGGISVLADVLLVVSNSGVLSINYAIEGETIEVYTVDGTRIATSVIENGTADVYTDLTKGTVAIVKIGEKNIKVVIG